MKKDRCECDWCKWNRERYPDLKKDPNPEHMGDEKESKEDEHAKRKR